MKGLAGCVNYESLCFDVEGAGSLPSRFRMPCTSSSGRQSGTQTALAMASPSPPYLVLASLAPRPFPIFPSLSEALGRSSAALNMCRDAGIAHIPGWLRSPRAQFRGKQRAKLAPWSMDVYGSLSAMHAEETRDGLVPPAPGHGNARQVRWSSCFHRVASRARNILMFIRVSFLWHFRSPITLSWEAQSNLKI